MLYSAFCLMYMISVIIIMYICKFTYKGYLRSQNKSWDDMSQINFEIYFMDLAIFPSKIIYVPITYIFIGIGFLIGKLTYKY